MQKKQAAALLEAARRVDAEVRSTAKQRNKVAIRLAWLLLDMDERGLARALGFASVAAYAEVAVEFSRSKTKQLVALARKLREMPELRVVAESGEMAWTKLRVIANAAGDGDLGKW